MYYVPTRDIDADHIIGPSEGPAPFRHGPERRKQLLPATAVHPGAIAIALVASATLLIAAWAGFAGGPTSLVLTVVTVLLVVLFGCLVGGGMMGRNMTPEREQERSFSDFLNGDVDIATGRISGREALLQIICLPITLAVGGIAIILIEVATS